MSDRRRQESWSGSESQRRDQGVCLPPVKKARKVSRYTVPAGCPCEIQKVAVAWEPGRAFTTTRETSFERYESYRDQHYIFRLDGWYIAIHRRFVLHRADVSDEDRPLELPSYGPGPETQEASA